MPQEIPHEHALAWAFEGPLWFCDCGAEFYPKAQGPQGATTVPLPGLRAAMLRAGLA